MTISNLQTKEMIKGVTVEKINLADNENIVYNQLISYMNDVIDYPYLGDETIILIDEEIGGNSIKGYIQSNRENISVNKLDENIYKIIASNLTSNETPIDYMIRLKKLNQTIYIHKHELTDVYEIKGESLKHYSIESTINEKSLMELIGVDQP